MPSAVRRGSNRWCTACGRVAISTSTTSRVSCRGSKRRPTSASISTGHNAASRAPSRVTSRTTRFQPGARYIVSVRDPRDTLVSAYRFFEGWFFEPGSIDIETLGRVRFVEGRTYYTHLASWWPHRHDANVLLLAYEHMKDDHEGAVRRVAEFIGFGDDDERIAIACQESSLASMKAHHDKYDDLMMRERSEVVCDLPLGSDSSKVRSGEVGAHRVELSERLVTDLDATWDETITADLGIPSYETLLEISQPAADAVVQGRLAQPCATVVHGGVFAPRLRPP